MKLSSSATVEDVLLMLQERNKAGLCRFLKERLDERYIRPVLDAKSPSGFAMLAIGCLSIEAIESFYQGLSSTKGKSEGIFRSFFGRSKFFHAFSSCSGEFYKHVRCGILHQAETTGGWRILRRGALLEGRTINAKRFMCSLELEIRSYINCLNESDPSSDLWLNFEKKCRAICSSCS